MWDEELKVRLDGRLVVLEPLGAEHVEGLRAAAADERIWRWMITRDVEAWIAAALADDPTRQPFAVLREGVVVGSTSYMSLAPEHLRLEIGNTWNNPSTWGTGVNVEAKYLLLRHAFEVVGCRRVEFKTDALNERARAASGGAAGGVRGDPPQAHDRARGRAAGLGVVRGDRRRLARGSRRARAQIGSRRRRLTAPISGRLGSAEAPACAAIRDRGDLHERPND